MELAIMYEYLIRSAYNCGRYGVQGADADIYRLLETRVASSSNNAGEPQLTFETGLVMGEVISWLKEALTILIRKNEKRESIKSALENCLDLLYTPSMENIDKCVYQASEVLKI